jgi:cyclic pyranopterin phosphate synthase
MKPVALGKFRGRPMVDPFGRVVDYLRVSVTDRCNLRCTYCMSGDMRFLPKADLLSLEEIDRLCAIFIERGVTHLRLTGGEPLLRRGIMELVNNLSRHLDSGALHELTLGLMFSNCALISIPALRKKKSLVWPEK